MEDNVVKLEYTSVKGISTVPFGQLRAGELFVKESAYKSDKAHADVFIVLGGRSYASLTYGGYATVPPHEREFGVIKVQGNLTWHEE